MSWAARRTIGVLVVLGVGAVCGGLGALVAPVFGAAREAGFWGGGIVGITATAVTALTLLTVARDTRAGRALARWSR